MITQVLNRSTPLIIFAGLALGITFVSSGLIMAALSVLG